MEVPGGLVFPGATSIYIAYLVLSSLIKNREGTKMNKRYILCPYLNNLDWHSQFLEGGGGSESNTDIYFLLNVCNSSIILYSINYCAQ